MPMPQNAQNIYQFLTGHGFSPNAAAGILGNIFGESGGNPESVGTGGNGLIGWTPPLAGAVTGNVGKDLAFQENALLQYIAKNGSQAAINANAASTDAAASYFIYNYERPANPAGDLPIRQQAARDVAAAAKSGNWSTSGSSTPSSGSGFSWPSFNPVPYLLNNLGVQNMTDLLERGALIILGAIFIAVGLWKFSSGKKMNLDKLKQTPDKAEKGYKDTHAEEAEAVEDAAAV